MFSTWCANCNNCDNWNNCSNSIVMHGYGEWEVCSYLCLKHLLCWIWTEFFYAFQLLSTVSACLTKFLWSINLSFFSGVPLPRKSTRQLVVFEDIKCNRDSSLTLKFAHKLLCYEPKFFWKSKQICDDRPSVIMEFF